MRALPAPRGLFELLTALVLALAALPAMAQDDEPGDDSAPDETTREAPPPRSGSVFGARPPQITSGGDDLTSGQVERTDEEVDDGRTELLVFDIEYAYGVEFRESYVERFETTFWEAVEASPTYRALTRSERQRRMARSAQMVAGEIHDEDAERIAGAIGVDYYLIPRVEIASSRAYQIRMTLGRAGEGEAGRVDFARETNRTIDNVDDAIEDMAADALAQPPGS